MSNPVVELFARIKQREESDGSWPGADVVDELCAWFQEYGIDPDDDPAMRPTGGSGMSREEVKYGRAEVVAALNRACDEAEQVDIEDEQPEDRSNLVVNVAVGYLFEGAETMADAVKAAYGDVRLVGNVLRWNPEEEDGG